MSPLFLASAIKESIDMAGIPGIQEYIIYRTRAIITRSWFETTLNYKPRILDLKIENENERALAIADRYFYKI